jgi:hypothetical protein
MIAEEKKGLIIFDVEGTANSPTDEDMDQNVIPSIIAQAMENNFDICLMTSARQLKPVTFLVLQQVGFTEEIINNIRYNSKKETEMLYHELAEEVGLKPGQLFIIDDGLINVDAANKAGAHGILYEGQPGKGMIKARNDLQKFDGFK